MKVKICEVTGGTLALIEVNDKEALALIESLSSQIRNASANTGRLESTCAAGSDATFFTIAVMPQPTCQL